MNNCKAMIAYRTFNQWCRRHIVRKFPGLFKGLREERNMLASAKLLTSYTHKRLRQIDWILGQGLVIGYIAKDFDEQRRIVTQILQEIK